MRIIVRRPSGCSSRRTINALTILLVLHNIRIKTMSRIVYFSTSEDSDGETTEEYDHEAIPTSTTDAAKNTTIPLTTATTTRTTTTTATRRPLPSILRRKHRSKCENPRSPYLFGSSIGHGRKERMDLQSHTKIMRSALNGIYTSAAVLQQNHRAPYDESASKCRRTTRRKQTLVPKTEYTDSKQASIDLHTHISVVQQALSGIHASADVLERDQVLNEEKLTLFERETQQLREKIKKLTTEKEFLEYCRNQSEKEVQEIRKTSKELCTLRSDHMMLCTQQDIVLGDIRETLKAQDTSTDLSGIVNKFQGAVNTLVQHYENYQLVFSSKCCICYDTSNICAMKNCGHLVCESCVNSLLKMKMNNCPACRRLVYGTLRLYDNPC